MLPSLFLPRAFRHSLRSASVSTQKVHPVSQGNWLLHGLSNGAHGFWYGLWVAALLGLLPSVSCCQRSHSGLRRIPPCAVPSCQNFELSMGPRHTRRLVNFSHSVSCLGQSANIQSPISASRRGQVSPSGDAVTACYGKQSQAAICGMMVSMACCMRLKTKLCYCTALLTALMTRQEVHLWDCPARSSCNTAQHSSGQEQQEGLMVVGAAACVGVMLDRTNTAGGRNAAIADAQASTSCCANCSRPVCSRGW